MMSDDMLSQEEIEALLRGTNINEESTKRDVTDIINVEDYLDSFAQDTLGGNR